MRAMIAPAAPTRACPFERQRARCVARCQRWRLALGQRDASEGAQTLQIVQRQPLEDQLVRARLPYAAMCRRTSPSSRGSKKSGSITVRRTSSGRRPAAPAQCSTGPQSRRQPRRKMSLRSPGGRCILGFLERAGALAERATPTR